MWSDAAFMAGSIECAKASSRRRERDLSCCGAYQREGMSRRCRSHASSRSRRPSESAAAHFQRAMMMDVDQAAKAMRDEEMLAEIEDVLEGFNQPTYRGMRINGERVPVWSSRNGWSGM